MPEKEVLKLEARLVAGSNASVQRRAQRVRWNALLDAAPRS